MTSFETWAVRHGLGIEGDGRGGYAEEATNATRIAWNAACDRCIAVIARDAEAVGYADVDHRFCIRVIAEEAKT